MASAGSPEVSPPARPTAETPWPVARLAAELRGYIDRLGAVWIEGELAQWNVRAGNVYAKLKDLQQDATVDLRVWASTLARTDESFAQGDRVVVLVKPDYWIKGGVLSMVAQAIRHAGLGALLESIERLRRTLAAEGLFDDARKRALPFLPQCIGLVTGQNSDAEHDVLKNARLRWPDVRFRIRHAAVQGERAATDVAAALRELDADPEVDVIIVARGGGDFQNLLPFSDEALLRTAAGCTTPIVSAIGHEQDRPLLDEVADLRASTPTDAAKRVVPDVSEQRAIIDQLRGRMTLRISSALSEQITLITQLRSRPVLAQPETTIDSRAQELTQWIARSETSIGHRLDVAASSLTELRGSLGALSPRATLARGYAIAQLPSGPILRRGDEASVGDGIRIRLASGRIEATVDAVAVQEWEPDAEGPA